MVMSPLLREAMAWFAIGCALGAFICATVFVFAASAPGMGGAAGLARSVGKTVDSILFPDKPPPSPQLRQTRRSFDHL